MVGCFRFIALSAGSSRTDTNTTQTMNGDRIYQERGSKVKEMVCTVTGYIPQLVGGECGTRTSRLNDKHVETEV